DALLADLETTTSLISKHPVLLTDPPRYSRTSSLPQPTPLSRYSRTSSLPRPTPLTQLTTVCKPKSPKVKEQPTFSSSSVLGGGLCELDRLLQELNATQFNITGENPPPPPLAPGLPAGSVLNEIMSQFPNEKGKEVVKTKEPPAAASAKLSAGPTSRGMESMPVSESSMRGEEVTPRAAQDGSAGGRAVPQTPARPSATSATLELDKLMASLSDFKVQSNVTFRIKQMKGSPKVHHVFREETPRKRLGPLLIQRSEEKDQLIGELHGRLGIVKCLELERKVEEDWLTEGVVVTSEPLRKEKIPPYQAAPPPVKVPASQPVVSKPPPPPAGGNLDNMLVMLQSDLSRQGISTVAKGVCAACQKPIAGQVVSALDQTWHPEHFVCAHCQREMGGSNFFEKDGLPYCERDYFQLFSPRCGLCNEPILDVSHPGGKWALGTQSFFFGLFFFLGFHEKDGKQYCRQDFYEMFATRCKGCTSAILENYISALNALWHPECFVCRECYTPFVNGSFFEHEGQPYCEIHYHKHRGSLCSGCEKPITGRCITAMGKKFHPEHFVCAFCLKQLNKGTFKEQNEKPYCHGCFIKLFG
uniref:Transforming growth factor beta 1 induced transcript 1 n=1 Tax=Latimeria chalumnae TaxID=7897 RepID=H2ZZ65_LATCH